MHAHVYVHVRTCRSQTCALAVSSDHKLQVLPLGSECMPRNRLTLNFEVIIIDNNESVEWSWSVLVR